jgi:hypothetical protein
MKYYLACLRNKNESLILPKLIKAVEKTNYSHVEIIKEYPEGVQLAYGAVFPKSRWCSVSELRKTYALVELIPLKVIVSDDKASKILFDMLGKPYSPLQLVIIYAKLYLTKFLSWLPYVKLNLDARMICTEFAGNFMQKACKYQIDISTETLRLTEVVSIAKKATIDSTEQTIKL